MKAVVEMRNNALSVRRERKKMKRTYADLSRVDQDLFERMMNHVLNECRMCSKKGESHFFWSNSYGHYCDKPGTDAAHTRLRVEEILRMKEGFNVYRYYSEDGTFSTNVYWLNRDPVNFSIKYYKWIENKIYRMFKKDK